jgi:N-glycosylase/DNA lyase
MEWAAIPAQTLNIPASLASGQAFRWRQTEEGEWRGTVGESAVFLGPRADGFYWQTFPHNNHWPLIERYFALDVDLEPLYVQWAATTPEIAQCCARYAGLRILRQDAEETLFSFLCASCNTIVKIRRSIEALAKRYGEPCLELDGELFYRFPTVEALAGADELALRADLWGFRAPRVIRAAQFLLDQPDDWLATLRQAPRDEATRALESLFGIGAKIADCIALFGLWQDDAVPIDTHVRQVAERLFRLEPGSKTLTPSSYRRFAGAYRDRFGAYAGWAQQYLFFAELTPNTALGANT